MRMGVVRVLFVGFEFGGVIAVVVFLVMLVGFLRSERGACKDRKQQSRYKELPHATNPNMISIAEQGTALPRYPKNNGATAAVRCVAPMRGDDGDGDDGVTRRRTLG